MKRVSFVFIVFLMVSLFLPLYNVEISPAKAQETGNFGHSLTPQPLNWTRFWQLFNAHSAWDLEYRNDTEWVSIKSDLQIIKNYTKHSPFGWVATNKSDASKCKITLNFTASYQADYRLTFGIDLDVKNYTHKEGSWNYTITYQNHSVVFDWSDIKELPLDSIQHGVKPVGEEQWFWFRIRKNNVPQGYNVVIDPSFGKEDIGSNSWGSVDYIDGTRHQAPASGTVTKIVPYITGGGSGRYLRVAIYDDNAGVPNNLLEESGSVEITGDGWQQGFTGFSVSITSGNYYWLVHLRSNNGLLYWYDTDGTDQSFYKAHTYGPMPDPMGSGTTWDAQISMYANYTLAGQTYTENPSINLVFSLASTTTFYGTYTLNPSVNLVFALASSLQHITAVWNVNPGINLVFSLSSSTQTFKTYIQNHAINLVFSLASTVQHITGQIFNVNPSIILNFAVSTTASFIQHYWKVSPSIILDFALSSTTILIQHLFHVSASINLIFQLSSTTVIVVPTEIEDVYALAAIAFIIAITAIAITLTKKD